MTFDSDRSRREEAASSTEHEDADSRRTRQSRRSLGEPIAWGGPNKEQAEAYYGCEIADHDDYWRLQQLESQYGMQLHQWIAEGIPLGAMGRPMKMYAYRVRKGTPIPWNIEWHNQLSVWRNAGETNRKLRQQPAGSTSVPDVVRDVISSRGRSLDASIRETVEEQMWGSFEDVQIHTGPRAAEAAEAIDARAFTVGNHIVFNHGEYDPESPEGQRVLVHELAHVRQQTGGALSMLPKEDVALEVDPDPELEREAEETARRVVLGGDVGIQRLSDTAIHVQRASDEESLSEELTDVLRGVQQQSDLADGAIQTVREVIESGGQFLHEAGIHFVAAGGADAVRAVIRLENSATETRDLLKGTNHLTDEQIRTIATVVADADSGPALAQELPPDALARTSPAAVVDLDNNFGVEVPELVTLIEDDYDLGRIVTLLRMEFDGTWSSGAPGNSEDNLRLHYGKHESEWEREIGRSEYAQLATDYLNLDISGAEVYYQPDRSNLAVCDTKEGIVAIGGTPDNLINTMYRDPDVTDFCNHIDGPLIKET